MWVNRIYTRVYRVYNMTRVNMGKQDTYKGLQGIQYDKGKQDTYKGIQGIQYDKSKYG